MGVLNGSRGALFLAIASRIVPEIAALDNSARAALLRPVEKMLGTRTRSMRREFVLFLVILRWLPLLRFGRSFDALSAPRQDAVLDWFFRSPLALLRKGFWGMKTLVFLGYYGSPAIGERIGYRPERNGNWRIHA